MAPKHLDFGTPLHHNLQHLSQPISLPTLSSEQHYRKGREGKEQQCLKRQRGLSRVTQGKHATSPPKSHIPVTLPSPLSTKLSCSFECSWMVMKHLVQIDFFVPPGCGPLETGVISYASLAGSHSLISRPLVYSSHLHYWFKRVCPVIIALTRNSA